MISFKDASMKSYCLAAAAILILHSVSFSQEKKNFYSSGFGFYLPAHVPGDDKESKGYGLVISGEHFFNKQFSGSVSIGYTYFHGQYQNWEGDTAYHFALVPLLLEGRYYIQQFYASLASGLAIKASGNTSTHIAIVPAIGVTLKKFDVGLKLFAIPAMGYGIPERTYLQKGGYSYIVISGAYRF